jgi:predicted acetyltransferase
MPQITIRDLPYEEATPHVNWLTSYAFFSTPPIRKEEEILDFLKQTDETTRHLVLFEDDRAAACAGAGILNQNVRGTIMPMSGIFRVATHPAARRKGYSFQVISELLKTERENGQPLTCLYPFRESFYARLGYVSFPVGVKAKINLNGLLPLAKAGYGENTELVEFITDPDRYLDFVEAYKTRIHGMGTFVTNPKPHPDRNKLWTAFAHVNGEVSGMLVYTLSGDHPTKFKFNISRFYYHNPAARYELLGWIGRHIDQTDEVTITLPPYEKPNTWYTDLDVEVETNWIAPMCRVLDVSGLDGIPCGEGSFSAQITDPTCPWNEGNWQFDCTDGRLRVTKTGQTDCLLSIQGLSALIYGTNAVAEFPFRGWGEIPEEVGRVMQTMFPTALPHMHAYF